MGDKSWTCQLCNRTYGARSSFVRHTKQCESGQIGTGVPRQKSCKACVKAKTRCDQRQPSCSRCSSRHEPCLYNNQRDEIFTQPSHSKNLPLGDQSPTPTRSLSRQLRKQDGRGMHAPATPCSSDFSAPDNPMTAVPTPPICTSHDALPERKELEPLAQVSDISAIQVRWLYPFIDGSPAAVALPLHTATFICRVLRTYPRMMARKENLPPFIHPGQMSLGQVPLPLANCFTLTSMWLSSIDTAEAGSLIQETITREMKRIFSEYLVYDEETLVAALQALVLYSIILLFPQPQRPSSRDFNSDILVSIQDVGYRLGQTNLVLIEEETHQRPSWQDWILVSAKRKTIKTLYIFEWMYAKLHNMPAYPCLELASIPAPPGKVLWSARTKEEWECAYDKWLGRWTGGGIYRMGDLAEIRPGPQIDERSEMWLEEADEFGMMLMSFVNASEGHLTGDIAPNIAGTN